jgi:hypothetical protein
VLPSNPIAIAAAITVSGAAIPAAVTIVANPKKKLIAGAMSASVAAAMSTSLRTPRAKRPWTPARGLRCCNEVSAIAI